MGALLALAGSVLRVAGSRTALAAGTGFGLGGLDLFGGDGAFIGPIFGGAKPRRRRRRRALTASDRADIGFIAGLLGPTAGKNFALVIAART